jgi:hypothetical protein
MARVAEQIQRMQGNDPNVLITGKRHRQGAVRAPSVGSYAARAIFLPMYPVLITGRDLPTVAVRLAAGRVYQRRSINRDSCGRRPVARCSRRNRRPALMCSRGRCASEQSEIAPSANPSAAGRCPCWLPPTPPLKSGGGRRKFREDLFCTPRSPPYPRARERRKIP